MQFSSPAKQKTTYCLLINCIYTVSVPAPLQQNHRMFKHITVPVLKHFSVLQYIPGVDILQVEPH